MNEGKFEYDGFSLELKEYINKAIEIYMVLREKKIENFKPAEPGYLYPMDKKSISLFLAGFLVNEDLKKIMSVNGKMEIEKFLYRLGLKLSDIKKIDSLDYKAAYDRNLKTFLSIIYSENTYNKTDVYKLHGVSPETIELLIYDVNFNNTIVDYVWDCDYIKNYVVCIARLLEYAENKGSLIKQNENNDIKRTRDTENNNDYKKWYLDFNNYYESNDKFVRRKQLVKPNFDDDFTDIDDSLSIDYESESIWLILDDIRSKFIGQEKTVDDLFYNIVNNQQLIRSEINDGDKSIIFIDGPTGTGKTAITREITSRLDIPIVSSSITNFSSTGYVGGNLTDLLKELYKKAGNNLEKAERGIVVLDEFDKIAYNSKGGLEMKRAVQQQLLDFMGGGKYSISSGLSVFEDGKVEFDTSKLTFVCLAALSNLRDDKTKVTRTIGFGEDFQNKNETYSITPQDLMGIGLERELVGRFNTYLHTEEYSKEDLLNILTKSTISPMLGFEKWVKSKGKYLTVEDGVYELIAEIASKLKTGARSLQTVVNSIRTHFLKEVLRGDKKEVILDCETINNIYGNIVNRKSKK